MASRQKVSIEEKVRIVRDCLKGKISQQAGARSVGVDQQTLESWIGIYENYGVEGFTRKQNRVYSTEVKTRADDVCSNAASVFPQSCSASRRACNSRQRERKLSLSVSSLSAYRYPSISPSERIMHSPPTLKNILSFTVIWSMWV